MRFVLNVFSSPTTKNKSLPDGRILVKRDLMDTCGESFADVYTHNFVTRRLRKRFGRPNQHEGECIVHVSRLTETSLAYEVTEIGSETVLARGKQRFDPEDAPIQAWALPIRDQSFVDRVLELGKHFEQDGEKQFQFEHVLELAPGVVFTVEHWHRNAVVFVDHVRFKTLNDIKLRGSTVEETDDLFCVRSPKFPCHLHDYILKDMLDQFLTALGNPVFDESFHKEIACCLWQRRVDLLPENW